MLACLPNIHLLNPCVVPYLGNLLTLCKQISIMLYVCSGANNPEISLKTPVLANEWCAVVPTLACSDSSQCYTVIIVSE